MSEIGRVDGVPGRPGSELPDARARLRQAAQDLEAVFINELFKAMRATAPSQGILTQDPGQELFTGMLDERLSRIQAERAQSELSQALYRQLSRRLPDAGNAPGAP
jgi:peptidoglycan hydrolase FlgJ